ncbi:hypothetical protein [Alteromonas sp. 14N.309.X.WAT.G.H12]|uniref:hypothetical protein n=1 Tax=Alteromonas sp. 14N.309.X.WAT.G.H12 TaxID=3120824 RepID=UPI002FCED119
MLIAKDSQGFESYGSCRDEEMLFRLSDDELSDVALMASKGWAVLPQKGRLFTSRYGHILLEEDDIRALKVGVESRIRSTIDGDALDIDPETYRVMIKPEASNHEEGEYVGNVDDHLYLPLDYAYYQAAQGC